jgi:hypothetical protein
MKPSAHLTSSILSIALTSLLVTPQARAQTIAPGASQHSNIEATQAAINPMTGRPLSEEDLHRQLNKSKLLTQLGQEQVKQAQNAADLVLANLRAESEKTRAKAESIAQMTVSGQSKSGNVTVIKPVSISPGTTPPTSTSRPPAIGNATPSNPPNPTSWSSASADSLPVTKASGTIRIGDETLDVAASTPAAGHVQVQWVDSQIRQVARAGSPLTPIQVQPATGVLGIPAIPGLMPGAMPPSLSQRQ